MQCLLHACAPCSRELGTPGGEIMPWAEQCVLQGAGRFRTGGSNGIWIWVWVLGQILHSPEGRGPAGERLPGSAPSPPHSFDCNPLIVSKKKIKKKSHDKIEGDNYSQLPPLISGESMLGK